MTTTAALADAVIERRGMRRFAMRLQWLVELDFARCALDDDWDFDHLAIGADRTDERGRTSRRPASACAPSLVRSHIRPSVRACGPLCERCTPHSW